MLDFTFDQILLRQGLQHNDGAPRFTTGSIVSGALMRAIITIVFGFLLWNWRGDESTYLITLIMLWGYVAYPAYRQYHVFNEHIEEMTLSTLCGQCKHFNRTGQTCFRYDEHVTNEYIPCEGLDWEPRS